MAAPVPQFYIDAGLGLGRPRSNDSWTSTTVEVGSDDDDGEDDEWWFGSAELVLPAPTAVAEHTPYEATSAALADTLVHAACDRAAPLAYSPRATARVAHVRTFLERRCARGELTPAQHAKLQQLRALVKDKGGSQ